VISEKQFAISHAPFWHQLLPMAEEYVRTRNRELGRFAPPLASTLPSDTRGVVNELGFRLFVAGLAHPGPIRALPTETVEGCVRGSLRHIRGLREHGRTPVPDPTPEQIRESGTLAERLGVFFRKAVQEPVVPFPVFRGCGWLDECAGDIFAERTLFEVKAGDRNFRSIDLRQVLTYCALNFASKTYEILRVCLVNPRLGLFLEEPIERLCRELAGLPLTEVLSEIVQFVSEPRDRYTTG